jgi:hypothetical protein
MQGHHVRGLEMAAVADPVLGWHRNRSGATSPHQLDSTHRSRATTDSAAEAASDGGSWEASALIVRGGTASNG